MYCQIQQYFQYQTDIIMSKSIKNILETYKDNIKQPFHQRRASQLPDSSTNNLQKQINSTKKVGMIIRNPSREMKKSNQKENVPIFGCEEKNRVNDQVMMKVKYSQLANKHTFNEQQKLQNGPKQSKTVCNLQKRNVRSASNHYQQRYNLLVQDYQKKKQKISHQIEKVRQDKTSKNALFFEIDQNSLQTPKFGCGFKKQIIKKLSLNVIEKKDIDFSAFINAIKKQMQLDQALRLTKHTINKANQQKITEILKKQYNLQENLTVLQADQFDPFAPTEAKNVESIASDLFKNHIAAEQYWNKHIVHNFQESLLTSLLQRLKARSQNSIILKDFVRQIGILTHNQRYLRNRDLFRIFKRLQPSGKDNFLQILRSKK